MAHETWRNTIRPHCAGAIWVADSVNTSGGSLNISNSSANQGGAAALGSARCGVEAAWKGKEKRRISESQSQGGLYVAGNGNVLAEDSAVEFSH